MAFARTEDAVGLWHLGSKSIEQKLGQVRSLRYVPRVADSFCWPGRTVSYFTSARDVTIACPEYYEHMPFEHFSPSDLPSSLERLELTFRNAAEFFKKVGVLRVSFPHLQSLTMRGIDGPKICFTTSPLSALFDDDLVIINPDVIEGISRLLLPEIEIALSEIDFLPKSLIELSTIVIADSGDSTPDFVPSWPPKLEKLDVVAHRFGAAVLDETGLGLSSSDCLTDLRLICTQPDSLRRKITDASISRLPSTLKSLEIRIGYPNKLQRPRLPPCCISLDQRSAITTPQGP